jgi:hypothetical protein
MNRLPQLPPKRPLILLSRVDICEEHRQRRLRVRAERCSGPREHHCRIIQAHGLSPPLAGCHTGTIQSVVSAIGFWSKGSILLQHMPSFKPATGLATFFTASVPTTTTLSDLGRLHALSPAPDHHTWSPWRSYLAFHSIFGTAFYPNKQHSL